MSNGKEKDSFENTAKALECDESEQALDKAFGKLDLEDSDKKKESSSDEE